MSSARGQAAVAAAIVLFSTSQMATAAQLRMNHTASSTVSNLLSVVREVYTTNAICGKKNCINPIFPGMEDLHRLQQQTWISSTLQKTTTEMGFCKHAIDYDPALPVPSSGGSSIKDLVKRQDDAAATMFYYHLAGLGLDAWDHQQPAYGDDCTKSIWRMVCYTYFPRAQVGTPEGGYSMYIRPCQSSCANYIKTCGVECCDESVQCVFTHNKVLSPTQTVTTEGYAPHDGPSSLCTGGARRSATPLGLGFWALVMLKALFSFDGPSVASGLRSLCSGRRLVLITALAAVALSLQGCTYDVPIHKIGNWRAQKDYLIENEFIPPGGSATKGQLNSCSLTRLSSTLQCSGRGTCRFWDSSNPNNELAFCECDKGYADPECRTPRKSQAKAYLLSMFFGMFGADQFYLGFNVVGIAKLFTLGGAGIWWVIDIIRIGSAPVYANTYRCAADLPHWVYVLSLTMFALTLGFAFAFKITQKFRAQRRKEAMTLAEDEESRQAWGQKPFGDAYETALKGNRPVLKDMQSGGYGSMPMGSMPPMGPMGPMGSMPPMGSMGPMGSMR